MTQKCTSEGRMLTNYYLHFCPSQNCGNNYTHSPDTCTSVNSDGSTTPTFNVAGFNGGGTFSSDSQQPASAYRLSPSSSSAAAISMCTVVPAAANATPEYNPSIITQNQSSSSKLSTSLSSSPYNVPTATAAVYSCSSTTLEFSPHHRSHPYLIENRCRITNISLHALHP